MAIDYGQKRTGIAVSDPAQIIAQGLTTVETSRLMAFLADYFGHEPVERVVIGRPVQNSGADSENAARVDAFIARFRKTFTSIPIETADERFTSFALSSDIDNVIIEDVLTSHDHGATFQSVMRTKDVHINNMDDKYLNGDYAYGSGIISFPGTQWLKLILRSGGATSDKIGIVHKKLNGDYRYEYDRDLPTAKRHVIRINNIELFTGEFAHESTLTTGELIDKPVKSLAIFANEYIPEQFDGQYYYYQYILTINGIDFSMVPLNSDRDNGYKIIRFTGHSSQDSYAQEIFESIKTARLTVKIYTEDKAYTPYLSNLKICYGEEAVN